MKTPRVVGVIPARYASQRLPAKPLLDLLGKAMVQRVYEQAKKATLLSRVIVATDDQRIADVIRGFGGDVIITAPEIKSGSDRVAAVAARCKGDIFLNIQGDEPLIAPAMIDQAARILIDDPHAHVGTLAKRITSIDELLNPGVVKLVVDKNSFALYFSRSIIPFVRDEAETSKWLAKRTFYKHIGLYVFRRDFLLGFASMAESGLEQAEKLEQLRILENGFRIKVGFTEHDSIPIDTQADVDRVVNILKEQMTTSTGR
jgi:3-deoxy-manno-octulosonate cytidylyltransferase (CMP-KDO synthetase)